MPPGVPRAECSAIRLRCRLSRAGSCGSASPGAVVLAGITAGLALGRASLGPPGPEGPPIETGPDLAPAGAPAPGASVDGIRCQGSEQVLFHIHARLTIYVNGSSRKVPFGVGIASPRRVVGTPRGAFVVGGSCFAWLHTHAADGATRVGPAKGTVTAFVDGKAWHGNLRSIPLRAHAQIQLDVGRPVHRARAHIELVRPWLPASSRR
jgi:hypothetical protein